ncbi:Co2+/Mg2+ efflux protein ApaG [Aureisphaera galaxeae]|uniref:Co2+/Mg2+ efflux protein ApaG n=1 Tax=Aureisphaera galaxeae TaxID=1538023 RepID=UPI00235063B0|nr:Co2+/Mg2+ efflux protein ApaG [Aureisphaera galaxeae]MDC8003261.1 Co2+/Mg2+ efflux protein ApaG [Aureisphaera galaxeae]
MIQLTTQGIKVSVESNYENAFYNKQQKQYAFSYRITIENNSPESIQLISRYWLIKDALNHTVVVEGKGVIGQQPIIDPGKAHTYESGCLLISPFGSMQGHYDMVTNSKNIKVGIPLFKLNAPFAMN